MLKSEIEYGVLICAYLIAKGDQQQKLIKEYGDYELGEIGKVTENCIFY